MKETHLLGLLVLIVILVLCFVKYIREGFSSDDVAHEEYGKKYQKKYNNVGAALVASKNEKALGDTTGGLFGMVQDSMDASNKPIQKISNPYPVEGGRSGMFDSIDKCEAVKTANCSAFDDPNFSKDCGICLELGTNSMNKPQIGGLVLTAKDKDYGKSQQKGNFLPPYEPTVGTCPAGRMVSSKAECVRLQAELNCQKKASYNSPAGCSQCFDDTSYHVVDSASLDGLIVGSGSLMVVGSGNLSYSESGQNNSGIKKLDNTPFRISLFGPEFNTVTLNLKPPPVPVPYDNADIYSVDDLVIFNNNIYKMVEGAGAPGYAPNRSGDRLWQGIGAYDTYVPPPPPFIAGYLTGQTAAGAFTMDLYRVILTDALTGRKPRTMDSVNLDGVDCTKMGPGFGKKGMNLTARSPFTFVDPTSQESSLCPNSPFVTMEASSNFLQSDPCYKTGSGPGNYSVECLQNTFLNNGCTQKGNGYPNTSTKASALLYDDKGNARKLETVADFIYANAISTATGLDPNGTQLNMRDWSAAASFCTGAAINSPCDANTETGPLNSDCIVYLWDNQGENKIPGATYSLGSAARSLFNKGRTNRFCSRQGTLAPKDMDGKENAANLKMWKKLGGVAAVKSAMTQLHMNANSDLLTEDAKKEFVLQCYGVVPNPRPKYTTSFKSDMSVASASTASTAQPTETGAGRNF